MVNFPGIICKHFLGRYGEKWFFFFFHSEARMFFFRKAYLVAISNLQKKGTRDVRINIQEKLLVVERLIRRISHKAWLVLPQKNHPCNTWQWFQLPEWYNSIIMFWWEGGGGLEGVIIILLNGLTFGWSLETSSCLNTRLKIYIAFMSLKIYCVFYWTQWSNFCSHKKMEKQYNIKAFVL